MENRILSVFLPLSDLTLGAAPASRIQPSRSCHPVWANREKKYTNLLFLVLPPLAVSNPRVPTSITPGRLDWFPSCSGHWAREARGTNPVGCTYEFLTHQIAPVLLLWPAKRPQPWLLRWRIHWEGYFHAPSICWSIFMFSDELTAQRKLLVISAQHCLLCVVLDLSHKGFRANLCVDWEQTGKHVDCTLPIKQLSVMSRQTAWYTQTGVRLGLRDRWDSFFCLWLFFQQTFSSRCLRNECEAWQQRMSRTNHL